MVKEKFVPIEEVPDLLKIAPLTMYRWLVDGRLIVSLGQDETGRQKVFVTESSIRNAYKVKCIHCG
mgnify:CR=1 FL=1